MSLAEQEQTPALRGDLTALNRDILFALARMGATHDATRADAPIGRAIRDELEAARGAELVAPTFYGSLTQLARKGLIDIERGDAANDHRLTPDGRAVCERQIRWESGLFEPEAER